MKILGIETSCDETGVAIYDEEKGLIANQLYSQIEMHADYGGVVPELASRDHIRKTVPLIEAALKEANLTACDIDGVAYTAGPGLIGALLVGATIARSLAYAWNVPALGVHHMEGHLLAPMLEETPPEFPFVALLISGGHTQLVKVDGVGRYELLGESIDDAAGEAFDRLPSRCGSFKIGRTRYTKSLCFPTPNDGSSWFRFQLFRLKNFCCEHNQYQFG